MLCIFTIILEPGVVWCGLLFVRMSQVYVLYVQLYEYCPFSMYICTYVQELSILYALYVQILSILYVYTYKY